MIFFTKLGILLIGFVYAGLMPYTIRKAIGHLRFDLKRHTLSFLSNTELYGEIYRKAYKRMLFITAILTYIFFWLMTWFYNLGAYEKLMRNIDICFASITLLAFLPHNLRPVSLKSLAPSLQRILHNLLAVGVFIALPLLIISFQVTLMPYARFAGLSGLVVILVVLVLTLISLFKQGINGATELVLINGISIWTIYITFLTMLH
jgi:hypothetical protein